MDVGDGEGDRDVQKADLGKWLPVRRIFRSMMGEEGRKLARGKKVQDKASVLHERVQN